MVAMRPVHTLQVWLRPVNGGEGRAHGPKTAMPDPRATVTRRVKQAATERVFGFEIMPAPFVVAHLQVGLTMQDLDAPLSDDGNERAGVS